MLIAIASTRDPKVNAVKNVMKSIKELLPSSTSIEYRTFEVDGGISMPRTLEELLSGAEKRVERLQQIAGAEKIKPDFFVGLEGGFHSVWREEREIVFLQSWACVSDGKSKCFGSSGNISVPESIAHEVMNNARDLGEVIDEVSNKTDIRSKQGTWGVLTMELLTRQQSFETTLIAAFAPFYNPKLYKK